MARSTTTARPSPFLTTMLARRTAATAALSSGATAAPRPRAAVAPPALVAAPGRGKALLTGVCAVLAAATAVPAAAGPQPCACGHPVTARHQRHAPVTTVRGPVAITRAEYSGPHGHRGHAPRERPLGDRAGSTSAGLDEVLALLGATADACAAASTRLARLTRVRVGPQLARAATATRGPVRQATAHQAVAAAWGPGTRPPAVATPPRRCRSLAGGLVHPAAGGRAEKRGRVVTTATRPSSTPPGPGGGVRPGRVRPRRCHCCRHLRPTPVVRGGATRGADRPGSDRGRRRLPTGAGTWPPRSASGPGALSTGTTRRTLSGRPRTPSPGRAPPLPRAGPSVARAARWAGPVATVRAARRRHQPRDPASTDASTDDTNHPHRMASAEYRARGLPRRQRHHGAWRQARGSPRAASRRG